MVVVVRGTVVTGLTMMIVLVTERAGMDRADA
jgi:hypothetical protein